MMVAKTEDVAPLDRWSPLHLVSFLAIGYGAEKILKPGLPVHVFSLLTVTVAWEFYEFQMRKKHPDTWQGAIETNSNIIGDLACNAIGYSVGIWLAKP
ncbi:MAG: hypothetical protein ACYTBZ_30185 [Planctomycetota bacterium]|jgi:hypothetical protein